MAEKRRRLEETARILRSRLSDLESRPVTDNDRPIHEGAVLAVRASLSDVGQQLARLAA